MCDSRDFEESGLSIQNPKLCGLLVFPKFKGDDWYVFVYTASDFTGELIDSPEGKLEWIPDEKVLGLNLWESDHIFMPWIREGKFFSAKFDYEGSQLRGRHVVFHSQNNVLCLESEERLARGCLVYAPARWPGRGCLCAACRRCC
jgi:hypothetical protein